jgi:hypothetical protein
MSYVSDRLKEIKEQAIDREKQAIDREIGRMEAERLPKSTSLFSPIPDQTADNQTPIRVIANRAAELEKYRRELEEYYQKLVEKEKDLAETYLQPPMDEHGKVAVMKAIPNMCPECGSTLEIVFMADRMRVRFRHIKMDTCSRTRTEFFRPIAQFVEFI